MFMPLHLLYFSKDIFNRKCSSAKALNKIIPKGNKKNILTIDVDT